MLYLMALQELTKCPFRVVDEINQVLAITLSTKIIIMTSPKQPKTLSVNSGKVEGNTECLWETKLTVSCGPVNKCFVTLPTQNGTAKKHVLDVSWHTPGRDKSAVR